MDATNEPEGVREAVGVFHDERTLQAAADDLLVAGFDRADLSLLAGHGRTARHARQAWKWPQIVHAPIRMNPMPAMSLSGMAAR